MVFFSFHFLLMFVATAAHANYPAFVGLLGLLVLLVRSSSPAQMRLFNQDGPLWWKQL